MAMESTILRALVGRAEWEVVVVVMRGLHWGISSLYIVLGQDREHIWNDN